MTARRIEIAVERLVLHGFDHADGRSIAAAIEAALSARFAEAGAGVPVARNIVGPLDIPAPSSPARIGAAVASAVTGAAR